MLSYTNMLEYREDVIVSEESGVTGLYLFLCALKAAAIPLEVSKGLLHQTVQIHLVAELQLRVSLQHNGHHHQQLHKQPRALKDNQKLQKDTLKATEQTHFKANRQPEKNYL